MKEKARQWKKPRNLIDTKRVQGRHNMVRRKSKITGLQNTQKKRKTLTTQKKVYLNSWVSILFASR